MQHKWVIVAGLSLGLAMTGTASAEQGTLDLITSLKPSSWFGAWFGVPETAQAPVPAPSSLPSDDPKSRGVAVTITAPASSVDNTLALAVPTATPAPSNGMEGFYDPVEHKYVSYDPSRLNPVSQRANPVPKEEVDFQTSEPAGSLIISTTERRLYLVLGNGRALRYGIGVGRDGFTWNGVKSVTRKSEWPDWRPPTEMIERRPDLPRFMPGGPSNPLGARAMYLGSTLYRIHGSNEPHTIGQAVSSGCFRMTNDDVTDLYDRVKVGAKVIVR